MGWNHQLEIHLNQPPIFRCEKRVVSGRGIVVGDFFQALHVVITAQEEVTGWKKSILNELHSLSLLGQWLNGLNFLGFHI